MPHGSDEDEVQDREWRQLHEKITELLDRYGQKNAFGKGDYWLVDDNWGPNLQQLEFQNLSLLRPAVIKLLQGLLAEFPDWEITVCAGVSAPRNSWPPADLTITHDVIVDNLPREFLPEQFRQFTYEGARPPRKVDLNDKSYIFRRALKS